MISTKTHPFSLLDTPIIAIQLGSSVHFRQLIQNESGWEAKQHTISYNIKDYSLKMMENNLHLELYFNASDSFGDIDRVLYEWDGELEKFIELSQHAPNSLGIPFQEALNSAEALILETGDLATAIPILTTIINEFEPNKDYGRSFSLPRALYLLGLAYEIQGKKAEAVAAYWRLWHDYPSDLYAKRAANKLEER